MDESLRSTRRDPARGLLGAVADDGEASMLGIADPDASAMVDADPSGAACAAQQGIEQGPIGDGVGRRPACPRSRGSGSRRIRS